MVRPVQARDVGQVGQARRGFEGAEKVGEFAAEIVQVATRRWVLPNILIGAEIKKSFAYQLVDNRVYVAQRPCEAQKIISFG